MSALEFYPGLHQHHPPNDWKAAAAYAERVQTLIDQHI